MNPEQKFAIECAVLDLAYAVRCRRNGEFMEITPLLDTLDDLRAAFPELAERTDYILAELEPLDTLDDLRAAFPELAERIDYILAELEPDVLESEA